MTYLPPRPIPYPLTHQSGDSQLGIDTNGIGDCNNPVLFGNGEEPIPVLVVLTGKQWERIYGALLFGADVIYPNAREQVLFDFTKWWDCPLDICQIIQDCIGAQLEAIQATVDALSTSVTNINNTVNNIETSTGNSATKPPTGITFTDASFRCGGALALVDYMHAKNMAIYAEAEASAVDNISEMIIAVLTSIPALETLPVGALGALTQSYFENQVTTYETDFNLARIQLASLLACVVEDNGNQMTYDVWGDWLELVETEIPGNTAAELFARYSPARQTLLNQIAALINSEQSLQAYFGQLFAAYNAGQDNPSNACEDCNPTFTRYLDFTAGAQGFTSAYSGSDWISGQGWDGGNFANQTLIRCERTVDRRSIIAITLHFANYTGSGVPQAFCFDGTTQTINDNFRSVNPVIDVPMVFTSPQWVTKYQWGLNGTVGLQPNARLIGATVEGYGTDPF